MKKRLLAFSLLVALILCSGISSAYAYFTTNVEADGSGSLELGNNTDITEEVDGLTKHIVVNNLEDSQPVFVRVQLFHGDFGVPVSVEGKGWSNGGDGYYYFDSIVEVGQSTSELVAGIQSQKDSVDNFNVIVVAESRHVVYEDGNAPVNGPGYWN